MRSFFGVIGLSACGIMILASRSSANEPEVARLIEEIESVWSPPANDQSKRGDSDYAQDYQRRFQETLERRVDLIGEFYRIAPRHPSAREFMMKRWAAMTHRLLVHRRDELLAEVRAIAAEAGHPFRRDAAYYKAFMGFPDADADGDGGLDALLESIEAFIALAPRDDQGAHLLLMVTDLANIPPDLRSSILDRILAEYPDSAEARNIELSRRRVDGIGKPFELAFQDVTNGKAISLQEDLRGKVVVIDFWATWCGPCVAETPKMKGLYAKYRDEGVEFIGVSLDAPNEDGLKSLKSYVHENEVVWPQFHGDAASRQFASSWGVRIIPTVFIIDRGGLLQSTEARGRLESLIPELLKADSNSEAKDRKF